MHHADLFIMPHEKGVKYGVPEVTAKRRDADGVAIERIPKEDATRGLLGLDAIYVPGAPPADYRLYGA